MPLLGAILSMESVKWGHERRLVFKRPPGSSRVRPDLRYVFSDAYVIGTNTHHHGGLGLLYVRIDSSPHIDSAHSAFRDSNAVCDIPVVLPTTYMLGVNFSLAHIFFCVVRSIRGMGA